MSYEELIKRTNTLDILTELANTYHGDMTSKRVKVSEALYSLALWRENLPRVSNIVSPSSLCSNCNDHIFKSKAQDNKPVVELWVEVETRCNLNCRFCYNFWRGGIQPEPKQHTTSDLIKGLHRVLSSVECELLSIAGGEPLLRSDLIDILLAIQKYSIPIALATNGVLLTPTKISRLIDAGVSTFQIPLHSHSEQIHDTLSAGHCWRKSLQAIIWLRELGVQVVPVFVATTINLSHFPQVLNLCDYLGLNQIIFNRFVPTGQGAIFREQIGVPSYEQLILTLEEADSIAIRKGIKITLGVPIEVPTQLRSNFPSVDWTSCPIYSGQRRWTIGADLQIRRCNSFAEGIGSVLDIGLERLLSELQDRPDEEVQPPIFRPCQLLKPSNLVQISSRISP